MRTFLNERCEFGEGTTSDVVPLESFVHRFVYRESSVDNRTWLVLTPWLVFLLDDEKVLRL